VRLFICVDLFRVYYIRRLPFQALLIRAGDLITDCTFGYRFFFDYSSTLLIQLLLFCRYSGDSVGNYFCVLFGIRLVIDYLCSVLENCLLHCLRYWYILLLTLLIMTGGIPDYLIFVIDLVFVTVFVVHSWFLFPFIHDYCGVWYSDIVYLPWVPPDPLGEWLNLDTFCWEALRYAQLHSLSTVIAVIVVTTRLRLLLFWIALRWCVILRSIPLMFSVGDVEIVGYSISWYRLHVTVIVLWYRYDDLEIHYDLLLIAIHWLCGGRSGVCFRLFLYVVVFDLGGPLLLTICSGI